MCTFDPHIKINPFNTAKEFLNLYAESKNNEYKKQVALNQIKNYQQEAQNQRQMGIEKAREAKIQGIKETSLLKAKNASNGFDVNSNTNLYNYDDINSLYNSDAHNILNNYYQNAQQYDNSAFDVYDNYKQQTKNKLYNYLGSTLAVSAKWYKDYNEL